MLCLATATHNLGKNYKYLLGYKYDAQLNLWHIFR